MFCANCGKELSEGEVCSCTQRAEEVIKNAPSQADEAAEQAAFAQAENGAQPNYFVPPVYQNGYNPAVNNAVVFPGTYYDPQKAYENAQPEEEVPARTDYPEEYKIKRKYAAVLLAASVGMFGIHNFYLGNKDKALAQLLIATAGGFVTLGLGFAAATIWAMVETVLLLIDEIDKDANGYKIQTFEEAIAKELKKD